MLNHPTWQGRSSPLLYIYHYIGIAVFTLIACYFFGPLALAFGIGGAISFIRQAWSMRYQLSRDAIYFSPSVDDKESLTLPLTKIMQIYVIDRRPWSWLNLGTVILLVDPSQDAQPCMKCLRAPEQLAEAIKSAAEAAGADTIAIQVLN